MCQGEAEGLPNSSEHCQVQKVASLLAQALKHQGLIEGWHDRKIVAGQEWDKVIDENLKASDIILLLITPDFMNSQYVNEKEIKRAIEKHEQGEARVIPIIVRPAEWEWAPFAYLQVLPRDGRPVTRWTSRDEAWIDVAKGIRVAVEELTSKRQSKGSELDVGADSVSADRYRKAVESVWSSGQLTKQEVEWLDDYADKELGLSTSSISDIEREVMGATKEAILERQGQAADERYRKAIEEVWKDNRLNDAEAEGLSTLASELGLGADRAAVVEREVTGDTVQAIIERQTREEEERQHHLGGLYARARQLHQDRNWQAVVGVFDQIRALDPEFSDREGLLESAREALERGRRTAAMYDRGLRHVDAEEWQQALQCFEEIQQLEPGYRDIETLLARVRHELVGGIEPELKSDRFRTPPGWEPDRPPAPPGW